LGVVVSTPTDCARAGVTTRADWLRRHGGEVDLVGPGGGTMIPIPVACLAVLEERGIDVIRMSGTSMSAIVACAYAYGMTPSEMMLMGREMLTKNRMLDRRPFGTIFGGGFALHSGDRMLALLAEHFPGTMSDAVVEWGCWAVDMERRAPRWFHSRRDADVPSAHVAMASSSVPGFFSARTIPGTSGLYTDGGLAVNVGADVWDDHPRPTIVLRLGHQDGTQDRRAIRNPLDFAMSVAAVALANASRTHISRRHWPMTLTIDVTGDALAFNLASGEIDRRYDVGAAAMNAWLDEPFSAHVPSVS
jgi:predicted acylesterase/phospholipase RssA